MAFGQSTDARPTQSIRGIVKDAASDETIAYATISLADDPNKGAVSNDDGYFHIDRVPVGRHTVNVSCIGYEPAVIKEIIVTSSKEVYLEVALKESVELLKEIVIRPHVNKEQALNRMATTGARMFSVEEASRYAGGFDDPARLASSFAGIVADGSSNGISIHGNAPHLLSWRMEGVEIPNPNHFADISVLGGGVFSSLSAHVLGNSDFLTGAFPAEYGNSVSGIFDVKLRNGNNQQYEHTAQVGTLGFDFASEGPLGRKNGSSYIINYRYSATGFADRTGLIDMAGEKVDYQDLNLKLNFPTRKAGTYTIWATGLVDNYVAANSDSTDWDSKMDENYSASKQYMVAGGIGHSRFFKDRGQLKATLAVSYFKEHAYVDYYDTDMSHIPYIDMNRNFTNLIADVVYNRKFSSRFTNKTGANYTKMFYKMDMAKSTHIGSNMLPVYDGDGHTGLLSAYSSNAFNVNNYITINFGLHAQWLTLNNSRTWEPRAGIRWQPTSRSTFAAAYGLHSRMEKIDVYFVESDGKFVNKDLDFTKSHHLMLSYAWKVSGNTNLKIEPYYQYLFDVPAEADGPYSVLNRRDFYVDKALVNKGKGRNYGIDVTLERYLKDGWYYLFTGSVFSSRYCGGDGVWHNTRYNRNYILNALGGKEWMIGSKKQNVLSVSVKLGFQGGERHAPVDVDATMAHPDREVQYDESRAFSVQLDPSVVASYTVGYKINRNKVSHEFAIKHLNATGTKAFWGHSYNYHTGVIEKDQGSFSWPNIAYRFEF